MFILFFGTRTGQGHTQLLHGVSCPNCQQVNTLTAVITPNYFHIFWLPLFTVSTSRLAECSYCKRAFYEEEFSNEMKTALE